MFLANICQRVIINLISIIELSHVKKVSRPNDIQNTFVIYIKVTHTLPVSSGIDRFTTDWQKYGSVCDSYVIEI